MFSQCPTTTTNDSENDDNSANHSHNHHHYGHSRNSNRNPNNPGHYLQRLHPTQYYAISNPHLYLGDNTTTATTISAGVARQQLSDKSLHSGTFNPTVPVSAIDKSTKVYSLGYHVAGQSKNRIESFPISISRSNLLANQQQLSANRRICFNHNQHNYSKSVCKKMTSENKLVVGSPPTRERLSNIVPTHYLLDSSSDSDDEFERDLLQEPIEVIPNDCKSADKLEEELIFPLELDQCDESDNLPIRKTTSRPYNPNDVSIYEGICQSIESIPNLVGSTVSARLTTVFDSAQPKLINDLEQSPLLPESNTTEQDDEPKLCWTNENEEEEKCKKKLNENEKMKMAYLGYKLRRLSDSFEACQNSVSTQRQTLRQRVNHDQQEDPTVLNSIKSNFLFSVVKSLLFRLKKYATRKFYSFKQLLENLFR